MKTDKRETRRKKDREIGDKRAGDGGEGEREGKEVKYCQRRKTESLKGKNQGRRIMSAGKEDEEIEEEEEETRGRQEEKEKKNEIRERVTEDFRQQVKGRERKRSRSEED